MTQTKSQTKNWQRVKLKDVTGKIASGGTPSRLHPEYFTSDRDGNLWVKSKELLDVAIEDTEEKITDDALNNSSAKYFPEHTVLIAMYGANVGQLGWLKKRATVNQAVCGLIIDESKANWRYVFYSLLQNRDDLIVQARGAAQQNLNQDLIKNFEIAILELESQRTVGSILGTYDDLIENNTKRIKILEEIAQAIYKEWFVYFRFPGHEKVRMIDSKTEFGKVPEGWKIGKLSDLAIVIMGQSPSSDFYNESKGGLPFHQGVTNFGFRFPATTTYSTEGMRRASAGDILFSVRAPVGRINMADRDMIIGRGLASVKSISGHQSFLLYHLKHHFQTEDLIGSGAIFASVTKDDLNNFSSLVPDASIIEEFERLIRSIDEIIFNITSRLSILKKSRDLLLPKLVTGEINLFREK